MLLGSSDREEDFDALGPMSWSVESRFLMGAKVSSDTHGTLLTFRRTRCTVINAFSLGITRIASEYKRRIQWRLYEAARIWRLKAPLGIGRNSFCLTFPLLTLCAVSFPRFRLLYKAPWKGHPPHPLTLELCRSSKFLFTFLGQKQKKKKDAVRIMGIAVEAKGTKAKVPPILQPDKKEHSLSTTRNRS